MSLAVLHTLLRHNAPVSVIVFLVISVANIMNLENFLTVRFYVKTFSNCHDQRGFATKILREINFSKVIISTFLVVFES